MGALLPFQISYAKLVLWVGKLPDLDLVHIDLVVIGSCIKMHVTAIASYVATKMIIIKPHILCNQTAEWRL